MADLAKIILPNGNEYNIKDSAMRTMSAGGNTGQVLVKASNTDFDATWGNMPTVPTNVSSFTNDAGYLTLATLPIYDGSVS